MAPVRLIIKRNNPCGPFLCAIYADGRRESLGGTTEFGVARLLKQKAKEFNLSVTGESAK